MYTYLYISTHTHTHAQFFLLSPFSLPSLFSLALSQFFLRVCALYFLLSPFLPHTQPAEAHTFSLSHTHTRSRTHSHAANKISDTRAKHLENQLIQSQTQVQKMQEEAQNEGQKVHKEAQNEIEKVQMEVDRAQHEAQKVHEEAQCEAKRVKEEVDNMQKDKVELLMLLEEASQRCATLELEVPFHSFSLHIPTSLSLNTSNNSPFLCPRSFSASVCMYTYIRICCYIHTGEYIYI